MNRYQRYFNKQVAEREKIFEQLMRVALERSTQRSSSGGWCSSEILKHLSISESGVLQVLKKQVLKDPNSFKNHAFNNKLRSIMLNVSLISNFKFKAPAVVADLGELETPELLYRKWTEFKNEMVELLGNVRPDMQNKLIFRHPVAGWLNLMETLQFMQLHQMHHMRQIVHRAGLL
jgi:uncharacterized damage-inducible protein DinB